MYMSNSHGRYARHYCYYDQNFCTYERIFNFCIPTITGVVSHFVRQMLTKPEAARVNANLTEKQMNATNKISNCGAVNYFLKINAKKFHSLGSMDKKNTKMCYFFSMYHVKFNVIFWRATIPTPPPPY